MVACFWAADHSRSLAMPAQPHRSPARSRSRGTCPGTTWTARTSGPRCPTACRKTPSAIMRTSPSLRVQLRFRAQKTSRGSYTGTDEKGIARSEVFTTCLACGDAVRRFFRCRVGGFETRSYSPGDITKKRGAMLTLAYACSPSSQACLRKRRHGTRLSRLDSHYAWHCLAGDQGFSRWLLPGGLGLSADAVLPGLRPSRTRATSPQRR